jgi:hypothetical protein
MTKGMTRPTSPPDPLGSLHVQLTLPPSLVAGRPLRYTVTLANPTTTAVSLRDCPSYQQRVSLANGAAAGERHLLNCVWVPDIRFTSCDLVGARNSATSGRSSVFLDQPAEPISPHDPLGRHEDSRLA